MNAHHSQTISYIVTAGVIGLVLLLRIRNMRRARRLRLGALWILPALLILAFAVATYEAPPPDPLGWLRLGLALAIGAALGWRRGKFMRISVDEATGTLNQQSSPAALLFIVVLIVARQALRYEAASMGINIVKVTGILMAFTIGLLVATRAEMFVRARRLLGEARYNPSGISTGPTASR